jgi:type IV pilus assembly protein PilC
MAEFVCRLGTPAGDIVTRTIEASAVHEARARLEREGFKVFNITPPKAEGLTAFTKATGGSRAARVKANDFLLFNQQLAALLRAGIPILQAISMLRRRATSVRLRAVLESVEEAIRGGAALSQAFAAQAQSSRAFIRLRFSPGNAPARSMKYCHDTSRTCGGQLRCAEKFAARSLTRCFF